jgi:hypothetical protein
MSSGSLRASFEAFLFTGLLLLASACERPRQAWAVELADPDPFARYLAAVALTHDSAPLPAEAAEVLVAGLMDPSARLRACSRRALHRHPIEGVRALAAALQGQILEPMYDSCELAAGFFGLEEVRPGEADQSARSLAAWLSSSFVVRLHSLGPDAFQMGPALTPLLGSPFDSIALPACLSSLAIDASGELLMRSIRRLEARAPPDLDREECLRARAAAVRALWLQASAGDGAPSTAARVRLEQVEERDVPALLGLLERPEALLRSFGMRSLVVLWQSALEPKVLADRAEEDPLCEGLAAELMAGDRRRRFEAIFAAGRLGPQALPVVQHLGLAKRDRQPEVRWLARLACRRLERALAPARAVFP